MAKRGTGLRDVGFMKALDGISEQGTLSAYTTGRPYKGSLLWLTILHFGMAD